MLFHSFCLFFKSKSILEFPFLLIAILSVTKCCWKSSKLAVMLERCIVKIDSRSDCVIYGCSVDTALVMSVVFSLLHSTALNYWAETPIPKEYRNPLPRLAQSKQISPTISGNIEYGIFANTKLKNSNKKRGNYRQHCCCFAKLTSWFNPITLFSLSKFIYIIPLVDLNAKLTLFCPGW